MAEEEARLEAEVERREEEPHREWIATETLPQVAEAFRGSYDHVVVNAGDMGFLGQGLSQVLATLDAFGVKLPEGPTSAQG